MSVSFQERLRGKIPNQVIRYTVTVREGKNSYSGTFRTKKLAVSWGARVQDAVDTARVTGTEFDPKPWIRESRPKAGLRADLAALAVAYDPDATPSPRPDWSLRRALGHYSDTVATGHKGSQQEKVRLKWLGTQAMADGRLSEVTAHEIQDFIDARTSAGRAANTVRNDVFLLSAVFAHANAPKTPNGGPGGGWGLGVPNPTKACHLPPPPSSRKRLLREAVDEDGKGEEVRLLEAFSEQADNKAIILVFTLALETGMRLSEILDLRVGQLAKSRSGRFIERPDSKNGEPRRVVLSKRAQEVLDAAVDVSASSDARIIGLSISQVEYRWKRARKDAGITGLRFHDLRHEGLTRMAGKGLTIGELMAQSGHKTAAILATYVNAKVNEISRKLG